MTATAYQADLFGAAAPPPPSARAHGLRPYQLAACDAIDREHEQNRSTLIVMATGTGKTQVFTETIRRRPGRALVIAHRDELIQQAERRIYQQTGKRVGVEKAERYSRAADEVVVASVQSLKPDRLARFGADDFALVIADEAHHAVSDSWRRVLDYFTGAKVLGVTATPDRADRLAMGAVFESVAFLYEIEDAIKDKWLCPLRVMSIQVDAIHLEGVETVAGDLNQGQLDEKMSDQEVRVAIARGTVDHAGDRRTIVFTTSVANAKAMAESFNGIKPNSARSVDGETPTDLRRQILADFEAGRFQYLINVGVLTEGFDSPGVSCVVMGRPTKSRALYTQCVGRGTRTVEGKADLLVLDFVGNAGKHRLVSALDILAGRYPDDVVDRARKIAGENPGRDASELLEQAKAEVDQEFADKERQIAKRAKVKMRTRYVDPFDILGIEDLGPDFGGQFGSRPAAPWQIAMLERQKVPVPEGCSYAYAKRIVDGMNDRRARGLCTLRQASFLSKKGFDTSAMTFAQAGALMGWITANGWRNPPLDVQKRILGDREPGMEG